MWGLEHTLAVPSSLTQAALPLVLCSRDEARFDELQRDIRMAMSRRRPGRRSDDFEHQVTLEVINIMRRFETCLATVEDPREAHGYGYVPSPIDTSSVRLPSSVLAVGELIAENCHEVWATGRIGDGWTWGETRDNASLKHPDLIPYSMLTEETKQYDRDTSFETLKVGREGEGG